MKSQECLAFAEHADPMVSKIAVERSGRLRACGMVLITRLSLLINCLTLNRNHGPSIHWVANLRPAETSDRMNAWQTVATHEGTYR